MASLLLYGYDPGLVGGVNLLKSIADKYDGVSYADLFQLASALAVKVSPSFILL